MAAINPCQQICTGLPWLTLTHNGDRLLPRILVSVLSHNTATVLGDPAAASGVYVEDNV